MANSTSHAALPYPIRNARFSLPVSFRVSAGTPTDPTTPDTEFSSDGGASFADTAEEITSGGTNGMGYLTLTGAETNNSFLWIAAKSANDLTTPVLVVPRVLATVGSGTLSAGSAGGGTLGTILAYDVTGCFIRTTGGTGGGGTGGANNQARKIATYTISTGAFTVTPNWETTPSTDTTYDVLLPEGVTLGMLRALNPATAGRTLVVDASGLADANAVKLGPTGSGTAQTARDIGASVLLSTGTGTGQLDFTSGVVKANAVQLLGTAWLTPAVAGTPDVNAKQIAGSATPATNLNTIFNTDYTSIYDTTNKAFTSKLGNFAMGGSSLALTTGAISGTTLTLSGAVAFQSTLAITGATTFTGAITGSNASNSINLGTDSIGSTQIAASAVTEIQSGLSTLTQTQVTGGAYSIQSASCVLGDARIANLDATISSRGTSTLTQTQVSGGAYALNSASFAFNSAFDFTTAQKTSLNAATPVASLSGDLTSTMKTSVTAAVWAATVPGSYTTGQAGYVLGTFLDVTVSSRSSLSASGVRSAIGMFTANLDTQLAAIQSDTDDIQTTLGALNNVSTAQVLAQVETALASTTRSLPGQATPSATPTLAAAIMQIFQQGTNPSDQTSSVQRIYNRAGDTVHQKRTVADDGTTFSLGALATGP